ncbi:PREDICTED: kelch-like protein 7 [Priapulus caudatus]|uniref:Kelch-like protein 7 n=1 Tax=Priapulus caudatus TaxID=37621 RepID=A0ABM1DTF6_PRICU|nr:PREDICTED: kelch-like protein 7 [Priapulus caudatus]
MVLHRLLAFEPMAGAPVQANQQDGVAGGQDEEEARLSPIHSLHIKPPISSPPPPILSPEGMDCFGNERSALSEQAKFYDNPLLSDVLLKVGEMRFNAHKLILVRASEVFERMLSSDWTNPRLRVCIAFACSHIIPKLQLKEVFHIWFQYATKCYHENLINSCIQALSEKMDDITFSLEWEPEWMNLDKDQLVEFLSSSDLVIKDEYELWLAVLRWLQTPLHPTRLLNQERLLRDLLPHVRFPMMTADQLCDVEKSKVVEQYRPIVMPYLVTAYKFHALSLSSRVQCKDFTGSRFLLRSYTELRWDRRVTIHNYSQLHRCSEVVVRLNTRSSSFPSQTWDWELKIYPKGYSSTNEDFRCILYSNVILDQPRAVEFMLSITDETKLLRTVTGKKNFSKTRYTADTEIDKKVTLHELMEPDSAMLVNDTLVMQLTLKPAE